MGEEGERRREERGEKERREKDEGREKRRRERGRRRIHIGTILERLNEMQLLRFGCVSLKRVMSATVYLGHP
jgi:hypothetical protein